MNVVRQDLSFDYLHTRALTCAQNSNAELLSGACVNASDTPPGVPGDVREHLESSMS